MKKILLAVALWLVSFTGFAQNEVLVQSNDKGLYVPHTVSPKENFYSIGRLYAISPRDIAAFNNVDMANGLNVGQVINIPLNATNFSQEKEGGTPVYYVVGEKEGLYRVSVKNNKVLMANLRKWNRLASDNISTGQKLIVGFIQSTGVPATTTNTTAVAATPAPQTQTQVQQPVTTPPPATTQTPTRTETPRQETTTAKQTTTPPPVVNNRPAPAPQAERTVSVSGSGYFKNQFEAQSRNNSAGKDQTISGSIFKTTSGWQDGKYYALMDGVEPGTIIRVVNPSNSKVVFAKVLGEMSGIRQNTGLDVRISNAAAAALEISDQDKFVVRVNY